MTAGVLRGQKSRFQLFGDTMNTASRMESNGVAGKIHVSQATADELMHQGKSHWVTPRPDKVLAKGKGELQTYWVSLRDRLKSTATASTYSSGMLPEDGNCSQSYLMSP
jgi:class 3 adenylate cyclase